MTAAGRDQPPEALPGWLLPLARAADDVQPEQLSRFLPPDDGGGRRSAVLILFGDGPEGPDLLVIERARDMSSHAGQPAFPGGMAEPGDDGPVGTALREAEEETGLDPSGVHVFATLPALYLPPSGFVVTPVVGWWRESSPVYAADPAEVAAVDRVPLAQMLDPANRLSVRHPSGYVGPAFKLRGLLVWGFTAGLASRLFAVAGWERPWPEDRVEDLPDDAVALAVRDLSRGEESP
ncbi:MAG: NUDIX hydrolase [Actinomycetes bacterium]